MKPKIRLIPSAFLKYDYQFGAVVFVHGDAGIRNVFGKPAVFYHTIYADSVDALHRGVGDVLPFAQAAAAAWA